MSILDKLRQRNKQQEETQQQKQETLKAVAKESKKDAKGAAKKEKADKKGEKKAAAKAKNAPVSGTGNAYGVLIRPIVTEKATLSGTYYFQVTPSANKQEVKKAIQQAYGVKPESVRIMNVRGKVVRWNYQEGKRSDWKKAIVRLPKGQSINVYEGI